MKKYEKVILSIFGIAFIFQLLDIQGKLAIFAFSTLLLSASYAIGGYWLFNNKEKKNIIIPILSGVLISISIYNLPYLIWLNRTEYYNYIPIPNGLLFIFLLSYLIFQKKYDSSSKAIKLILTRSFIVLLLSTFFTYTPISYKPFRNILYYLNTGDNSRQENIKMFEYTELYEIAIKNEKCEKAIKYAEKANKSGLEWLEINVEEEQDPLINQKTALKFSNRSELWKINGTYSRLHLAYVCKAKKLYKSKRYEEAIEYYEKSDHALENYEPKSDYWKLEQVFLKNQLGLCYLNLQNYQYADSLFVYSIEEKIAINDIKDRDLAQIYTNLGESQSKQSQYEYANLFFNNSIQILKIDSTDEQNKEELINNFLNLTENHFKTDSLERAKYCIDESFKLANENNFNFYKIKLYKGLYYFKISQYLESEKFLSESLEYFRLTLDNSNQNIAQNLMVLAQVKIALAQYENARDIISEALKITAENFSLLSARFAAYLKVDADIDNEVGNYYEAEKKYNQIINILNTELGNDNEDLITVLSSLADVEISLIKLSDAKIHSDKSMSLFHYYEIFETPTSSNLLNNSAYINYCNGLYNLSDSLYHRTIDIHNSYNIKSTAQFAIALNGLGLVMTEKKDYNQADSLFKKSLAFHKSIFSENHPLTAVVLLNYAILNIENKNFKLARDLLNKSLEINEQFFDKEHDVFGDIYSALGDLNLKEKKLYEAKEFYNKARKIYTLKFGANYQKVIILNKKIKNCS